VLRLNVQQPTDIEPGEYMGRTTAVLQPKPDTLVVPLGHAPGRTLGDRPEHLRDATCTESDEQPEGTTMLKTLLTRYRKPGRHRRRSPVREILAEAWDRNMRAL